MSKLVLRNVSRSFGDFTAVENFNLALEEGELVSLLGPSGCGKTTTLRMIAGFMTPTAGTIELDGQVISSFSSSLPPEKRQMSMIFQSYAIWPNMTVAENVSFGLKVRKVRADEIRRRVDQILEVVQLGALRDRYPAELSGGQQQRVALARSIVVKPAVLLLDEPLSNLDANLRLVMREEIRKLQERLRITTVFVTHDQFEAMAISDRLVVMKDGRIEQVGSPIEIYEKPANEFIAGFVGYVNFMDGRIASIDEKTREAVIATEYGDIAIALEQDDVKAGDDVLMVIRPESVNISLDCGGSRRNVLCGNLKTYMYAGSIAKCTVTIGNRTMIIDQCNPRDAQHFKHAEKVEVEIPRSVHLLKKKK